jgi:c(7)-type cytochrome triheme protein
MKRLPYVVSLVITIAFLLCSAGKSLAESGSEIGDIIYTQPLKSVTFSHKVHVDEKKIGCEQCHAKLFDMQALAVQKKPDFTMKSLYQGKYCGACHDGKAAFASNTQCARCHNGVKGFEAANAEMKDKPSAGVARGPQKPVLIGTGDVSVLFRHDAHTGAFKCSDCHTKLFSITRGQDKITMDKIYKGQSCGACHNGKKAFSSNECAKCHAKIPAPKAALVYKPEGIGVVKFSHEFHTVSFTCKDCHDKIFPMRKGGSKMTMDVMNTGGSCGTCHNGTQATAVTECGKCHAQ